MSDNFENNNGIFDNNEDNCESENESFPNTINNEPEKEPQQADSEKDFSSGEYHFAYPKSSDDNSSSFDADASQPTDVNSSQDTSDSSQNTSYQGGYSANNNAYSGSPNYYNNPNPNGQQNNGYTPYNWNNQGAGANYGSDYNNNYNNRQNNGYYNQANQPYHSNYGSGYNPQQTPPPKKKGKGGRIAALVIVIAVVVVALICVIVGASSDNSPKIEQATTAAYQGETQQVPNSDDTNTDKIATTSPASTVQLSAVDVAEKARKSVVGVMTYKNGQLSGEGSGVVMGIDSTGAYTYIITCAHVINESNVTYGVQTLDDKKYTAELVATDTRTDIGVLKVNATDLSAAEFGDSTALRVGETVYAIGNPGGSEYFGSMTDGIVSAIDRSVSSTYNITCIQHNAAINPGNSGGALLNAAGQVIGINSSKIAATDYEGMGFAIPMSTVSSVVDDLIKYGYVPNRPKLGIEYAPVDRYELYSMVVAIKGLPAGSLVIAGISSDSSLANT
ncbi:MAG: S1C family serine protease, partial [Acutalibacteraceae bacterium]